MLNKDESYSRIAFNICAAHRQPHVSLIDACYEFTKRNFPYAISKDILSETATHRLACVDFFNYDLQSGERFAYTGNLKGVMRELWLYRLILANKNTMSLSDIRSAAVQKFQEELKINPDLTAKMFGLSYVFNQQFYGDEQVQNALLVFEKVATALCFSLDVYGDFLASRRFPYMKTMFGNQQFSAVEDTELLAEEPSIPPVEKGSKPVTEETAPIASPVQIEVPMLEDATEPIQQEAQTEHPAVVISAGPQREAHTEASTEEATQQEKEPTQESTIDPTLLAEARKQLVWCKSHIDYLERTVHEKDVKIQHSEKDAIRTILSNLVSEKFGSPLNELYLYWKSPDSPEAIRKTVSNLFLALEGVNVKLVQERMVGHEIELTRENADKFTQVHGSNLTREDRIKVRYPGYRFGKDVMIKPTVQKVEDVNE